MRRILSLVTILETEETVTGGFCPILACKDMPLRFIRLGIPDEEKQRLLYRRFLPYYLAVCVESFLRTQQAEFLPTFLTNFLCCYFYPQNAFTQFVFQNHATLSLNNFIKNYEPPFAYKLISGNVGISDAKITLPLYMTMFI